MKGFSEKTLPDVLAFTSMFDFIKDLVFFMEWEERSFRYIYVNPSALQILNIEKEVIGEWIEDVLPQHHSKRLIPKYHRVISTQQPVNFVEMLEIEHGQFIGETSLNPVLTEDGQCKYVLAIVRDITERKQKERGLKETKEELERNQKRLNSLIENNGDAVYELDRQGNFLNINSVVTELTGYEEKELIGMSFFQLIVEDALAETFAHFNKAVQGHKEEYTTWVQQRNGQKIHLFVKNVPIIVEGLLVGVYGIAKDITEKHRLELLLKESEEKYRLITENAFDVIKLVNSLGMVEYVSPSNEMVLGYTSSEYIGKHFTADIHPDDRPTAEKEFKKLIKRKELSKTEIRHLHKKGHWVWLEVVTTPIIEDGKVKQFVSVARDITDRKNYRDKLAKMAFYDYLSGLPNRRMFEDRLDMAIHQANRSKRKVAVMILDGRNFKKINDTFGHDAGDAVIKEMAKRLQECVRKMDTVARLGGDEIGIVLPELDSMEVAEDIVKRIFHSFEEPLCFNNVEIEFGAGIGMAFYPDHSMDKKQLVKYADEALYKAKESAQNEYRIYR